MQICEKKTGLSSEPACKLLWQWYAAITQHIPHGTEDWISKLIKVSAMKRPQTPAKNPARSLQKLSLQKLHAKPADADTTVIYNEKWLKKIRIDIAVRKVVRDSSSSYWHSMKVMALLFCSFKVCMGGEGKKQTIPMKNLTQGYIFILFLVFMSMTLHCNEELDCYRDIVQTYLSQYRSQNPGWLS